MVGIFVSKAGGLNAAIATVIERYPVHVPLDKQPSLWMLAALVFMTSFGPWGLPQMVQKFYSIKDEKMILRGALVTTVFALIITTSAYFVGALAHAFLDKPPLLASGAPNFDGLIPTLLTTHLPQFVMAIILLLVLSASMSTLSSLVLVSASAVAIDLYKGHVNPRVTKENSLMMMRFISGVFVALSFFIAKSQWEIIVTLMSLSWGAVAGSFMAPFLYGLYWKRTTLAGVWCGMISGLSLAVILFFKLGPKNAPIAASIAMIVPFIVVPAVSLFTRPPTGKLIDRAFEKI
jgi:SSS family solute:Na+ symporter